jgi:cytidylate kinase
MTVPDANLMIIAIDGPAGSGKSTVARGVADALDLDYLDTGAMYRSVTYAALSRGIDPTATEEVAVVAREITIDLEPNGAIVVDGTDATSAIRSAEVSRAVSTVAANQAVRTELVARQRDWARKRGGGVLEGRDIGTVVFPNAALKVYLTASTATRAARRALEERNDDRQAVEADLARRDLLDSGREHDPLRQAGDAFVLDTTDLTIDEVVKQVVKHLHGR